MKKNNEIVVSVIITTYNQENWIRQTIESVLNQKTQYAYEIIIGEDCSNDSTLVICQEYATKYENITVIAQNKNQGVVTNWVTCVQCSKGKYIMGCAGDDFWHNPNKIQLQVDFMENHPDCIMCHTDFDKLFVKTGGIIKSYNASKNIVPEEGYIQDKVLAGKGSMVAITICFRAEKLKKYCPLQAYISLEFPREDWPTIFILSAYGEICYLPISTVTYRVGHVSITNSIDYEKIRRRALLDKRMTEYLYSLFPKYGPFKDAQWYDTYVYHILLIAAYENNDYKNAKRFAKKDPQNGLLAKMAKTYFTFQLFRLYRNCKSR